MSTPAITFRQPTLETCKLGRISWSASGAGVQMIIFITNIGIGQPDSNPSPPLLTEQISLPVPSGPLAYQWPKVNVTQGWYELVAKDMNGKIVDTDHNSFFVRNGNDTSCVQVAPSSSVVGDGKNSTTTFPTGIPASTPSVPIPRTGNRTKSPGIIVGPIIGGVVLVIALVVLLFLARRRKNRGEPDHTRPHPPIDEEPKSKALGIFNWKSIVSSKSDSNDVRETTSSPTFSGGGSTIAASSTTPQPSSRSESPGSQSLPWSSLSQSAAALSYEPFPLTQAQANETLPSYQAARIQNDAESSWSEPSAVVHSPERNVRQSFMSERPFIA